MPGSKDEQVANLVRIIKRLIYSNWDCISETVCELKYNPYSIRIAPLERDSIPEITNKFLMRICESEGIEEI